VRIGEANSRLPRTRGTPFGRELYVWQRTLWTNIACHWLTDAAGFLLMPAVSPHH
jgi:hypothetical protein